MLFQTTRTMQMLGSFMSGKEQEGDEVAEAIIVEWHQKENCKS